MSGRRLIASFDFQKTLALADFFQPNLPKCTPGKALPSTTTSLRFVAALSLNRAKRVSTSMPSAVYSSESNQH